MPKCKKVFKNLSLGFYTDTIPIENDVFPLPNRVFSETTERKAGMEAKETGDWEKLLAAGCLKDG